jgi:crotonobetainyl-CoA:carnitine CoA-transferase CaiB-like acyl-CoA transferase
MLADVRVLEISTPMTMLGGQILGDLGADVIALEPPAGAAGRRLPPFIGEAVGLNRSLAWHALNRNKRGITLDIASQDGHALLLGMLSKFDILIGEAADLRAIEPPEDLIVCSISAFSDDGPKANYRWTDAVITAAGGAPAMAGEIDRAPLFFPVPQTMMEAGAECAVAALAGLVARDRLGFGQTVEVQARVAAILASLGRIVAGRSGDRPTRRAVPAGIGMMPHVAGMYQCADGWVTITVAFVPAFVAMTHRIRDWLIEENALPPEAGNTDLLQVASAARRGENDGVEIKALLDALSATCMTKTKSQIIDVARLHRFMAAPAMNMADIAAFPHYRERGLFDRQLVGGRMVDVPARFAQFSDFEIAIRRPAPELSADTAQVLSELAGLSPVEVQALFIHGVI